VRLLDQTAHRPFPPPAAPWIMHQRWHDVLFAHWPLDPADVLPALPPPLRPFLDTFDGRAWVGVIAFWMSNVRPRFVPPTPGLSTFPELNVRTYLTIDGKSGVFFFSLDAASRSAVLVARAAFSLPYFRARMSVVTAERHVGDRIDSSRPLPGATGHVRYVSERLQPPRPAEFRASYGPIGLVYHAQSGSIDHFLVERYCLYTTRGITILRGVIHHCPWPLQPAEASIELNTVVQADGLPLPDTPPLLRFAKELDVLVWWPERAWPPGASDVTPTSDSNPC
jgi:uncharacterized protein